METIEEIESKIKEEHRIYVKAQRKMIERLSYLKATSRYKENPQYKDSSFKVYLMGQFNMRLNTFYENERALIHYPEFVEKYGIGLVAKIYRKCGAEKEKMVFSEIEKAQGKLKTPIKQDRIECIIKAHLKE